MTESRYVMGNADGQLERARLGQLGAWLDPVTTRYLDRVVGRPGLRCLDVGAGAGSITRWLSERVGPTGSVVATDLEPRFLTGLPANVEVRKHDLLTDDLEPGGFDVVHCRAVLMHLRDPAAGFRRLAAAVAPGGWLVTGEGDFGLTAMVGPDGAKATAVLHEVLARLTAAEVMDAYFGRKLPGFVNELGWEDVGYDGSIGVDVKGSPAYEMLRLGWPQVRLRAVAVGVDEADLAYVDVVSEYASTPLVALSYVAAWARRPMTTT